MVRARGGLADRAGAAQPRPDRAARPAAERLPQGLRREGAARSRAGRGAAARRARSGRCSGCRSRSRTKSTSPARSTTLRHRRLRRSRPRRTARWCGACARRARSSSASPCFRRWRSAASPSRRPRASPATPGTRSGRRAAPAAAPAAAVAAGLVPIASAGDGARLDPDPGRLLRPLRPQAFARAGSRWLPSSRAGTGWRCSAASAARCSTPRSGSTSSPAARSEPEAPPRPSVPSSSRRGARPGSCASPGPPPRRAAMAPPTVSEEVKRAVAEAAELLRLARPRRRPSRTPTGAGSATTSAPASCAASRKTVDEVPHPGAARTPHPRLRPARPACCPTRVYQRAVRARARCRPGARINAIFDSHDVLVMPAMGGTALPVRRWEGRGAIRTVLGMSRFYPYCVPWNHLGNPAMAVPFGFDADGMPLSIQVIGRPRRRGDAALPRRPDRGRAPLGGPPPADLLAGPQPGKTLRIRISSRTLAARADLAAHHRLDRALARAASRAPSRPSWSRR